MFLDDEWFDGAKAAIKATLKVDAQTKRAMVQFLLDEGFWDKDMKWDSALARFDSCLNPTKSEFFKISEVWALMKHFQRFDLFLAMGDDLGFEVRRRPSLERVQYLLEQILERLDLRDTQSGALRSLLQEVSNGQVDLREPTASGKRDRYSRGQGAP